MRGRGARARREVGHTPDIEPPLRPSHEPADGLFGICGSGRASRGCQEGSRHMISVKRLGAAACFDDGVFDARIERRTFRIRSFVSNLFSNLIGIPPPLLSFSGSGGLWLNLVDTIRINKSRHSSLDSAGPRGKICILLGPIIISVGSVYQLSAAERVASGQLVKEQW